MRMSGHRSQVTGRPSQVEGHKQIGRVAAIWTLSLLMAVTAGAEVMTEPAQVPVAPPQAPPPAKPVAAPTAPTPARTMPTRNVRVSVVITDQAGTRAPVVKTVSMVIADGRRNQVRSTSRLRREVATGPGQPMMISQELLPLQLNVDAQATITPEKRVLLELRFNYGITVPGGAAGREPAVVSADSAMAEISEELALLLAPGASVVAAESADATSDRKVKVEVQAEILP